MSDRMHGREFIEWGNNICEDNDGTFSGITESLWDPKF